MNARALIATFVSATAVSALALTADVNQDAALLAAACAGCHQAVATVDSAIPSMDGLSAVDIETALIAYRSGTREGTIMGRLAKGYTEAQIAQLAAYLAAREE